VTRVPVGILGLGSSGRAHFLWYRRNRRAEVAAVYDPRWREIRSELEGNPFFRRLPFVESEEELFRRVEAVSICTPDHLHFRQIGEALRRGKHLLVEKPVVTRLEEIEAVRRLRECSPTVFAVHQQMRIVPAFSRIKELVRQGAVGEVFQVQVEYRHDCRGIRGLDWRLGDRPQSVLLGGAIHPVDYALWLLEEPVAEAHLLSSRVGWKEYPAPTSYSLLWKTEGGRLVSITSNHCQVYPFFASVVVMGDRGTLVNNLLYREGRFRIIRHNRLTFAGYPLVPLNLLLRGLNHLLIRTRGFVQPPFTPWEWSLASRRIVDNFVESIRGGTRVLVDFESAAASLKLCLDLERQEEPELEARA
jgi:UDP-N-acetylglucosamine 3-dehydrogenase